MALRAVGPSCRAVALSCSHRTPCVLRFDVRNRLFSASGLKGICPVQQLHDRPQVATRAQQTGGLGDEDVDVAVFRFTLGIPGFDDRLIPRVVGLALAALLAVNHVFGAQPTPDAQVRSEYLGAFLAGLCFFVPDVEERLREALPGRGRQKAAEQVDGATNGFFLDPALKEASKKELAWASYALLKNTNCCSVVLYSKGQVLMARGALGATMVTAGNNEQTMSSMAQDLQSALKSASQLRDVATGVIQRVWLPERSMFGAAGVDKARTVPAGAQSLLAQHVGVGDGEQAILLVYSERPRALTDREQGWVSAIADKLAPSLV